MFERRRRVLYLMVAGAALCLAIALGWAGRLRPTEGWAQEKAT